MKFGTTANPRQLEAMGMSSLPIANMSASPPGTPEEKCVAEVVLELHKVGIRGKSELLGARIVPANRIPKPH